MTTISSPSVQNLLPANDVLAHADAAPPALHDMAQRFEQLLGRPAHGDARDTSVAAATPLGKFVEAQEKMMQASFDSVHRFTVEAPNMDMHTLAASQISLSYQVANMQLQFNAGVQMAQTTKSGLQTLMKNQ